MSDTPDDISGDSVGADHPQAASISAIDKKSVHRICSGQVVLTLATAVKELLENSIDAKATIVEIKLKDYGSESIEVSDNGAGVESANFEGLTLKHHTSKLQDFGDLVNVETFGFRGEALSSLCALCDMSVTTRHQKAAVGTKLQFDYNGRITKQTSQARQVGTTVSLLNLFHTLPVRHKEFRRNVKKEFIKMVQVLNAYCIVSTRVRVSCTNQTGKGSKSVVVSTSGNASLNENIANVFGPKQMGSLLEFVQKPPDEGVCSEFGLQTNQAALFSMDGYVSKCEHGQGRSSTDRQFYFINGRPFDSTKLCKVVNEVYHQYNRHQYPFVALRIKVEKESVDVNVTPDKRQVFLEREKQLLAIIKASLVALYEPTTSVLQMQMPLARFASGQSTESEQFTRITRHESLEKTGGGMSSLMKLKRSFSSAFAKDDPTSAGAAAILGKGEPFRGQHKQRKLDGLVSTYNHSPEKPKESLSYKSPTNYSQPGDNSDCAIVDPQTDCKKDTSAVTLTFEGQDNDPETLSSQKDIFGESHPEHGSVNETGDAKMHDRTSATEKGILSANTTVKIDMHTLEQSSKKSDSQGMKLTLHDQTIDTECVTEQSTEHGGKANGCQSHTSQNLSVKPCLTPTGVRHSFALSHGCTDSVTTMEQKAEESGQCSESCDRVDGSEAGYQKKEGDYDEVEAGAQFAVELSDDDHELDEAEKTERQEKTISFSLKQLQAKLDSKGGEGCSKFSRAFRATITPGDNQAAEQELQREITKDMFGQMEILGQFNKGFIIVRLENDLFIVDQHATDEKFNFETLQRDTVIQSQKLICPQSLDLTASNEIILMDNLDTFRKNGFEFAIDENAQPTQRVKLASTPISKNWLFGKEDIEEMIFMLSDSPGVMCRPSRVRAMFASRSCRKSVMIGTTLNKTEMKKLVCHMGEIEQPWNCPHGRPTMRHLINLDMVPK